MEHQNTKETDGPEKASKAPAGGSSQSSIIRNDTLTRSTPDFNRTVVERFNDAINRHDLDGVMQMMTDDCLFESTNPPPDGARFEGAAAVRAYWQRFFDVNPEARFEPEEVIFSGDRCVVRWVYHKTKEGKPWHLRGVDIFHFREGKIAAKLSYVKG